MADFSKAYDLTMGHEGGYANNPIDTGGETYKGVARNFNPKWEGWKTIDVAKTKTSSVDALNKMLANDSTLQVEVKNFYQINYWHVNRLTDLKDQVLAEKLFDIGVNMGVGKASRMLQEAVNLTNQNGRIYPDIIVDGVIGPKTLELVNKHPRPVLLLKVIKALQGERYLNIMRNAPTQEVFANTWFSRV